MAGITAEIWTHTAREFEWRMVCKKKAARSQLHKLKRGHIVSGCIEMIN